MGGYQLLAAVAERAPTLFKSDLSTVQKLFVSLSKEPGEVRPAVAQAAKYTPYS